MRSQFKLALIAGACLVATAASAQVAFDANYENDTTYTDAKPATTTNEGRAELNATAMAKNGSNFVSAKGTIRLKQDGTNSIEDAWIKAGTSAVDVTLGRFEAADLFPTGQDTLVSKAQNGGSDAVAGYTASALRGRTTANNGTNPLHAVVGVNAGALRAELGLFAATGAANTTQTYGLRPTLVYTAGALTLRGGFENIKATNAADQNGYGLSVGYALSSSSNVNVNYASNTDSKNSSVGANATFGGLGLGVIQDKNNTNSTTTFYASYAMPLLGVKGATLTPAISNSTTDVAGVASVTALRARINYAF
ncbi:carbohydrate porin [Rhodoferax sp.]|uniref:carbohydrate porin n=1 Tax=Rhodoferax sp. TaxID=50421 RepID=UPI0025D033B2|nr:carbohydrate porin [Rhodoferax sp.]